MHLAEATGHAAFFMLMDWMDAAGAGIAAGIQLRSYLSVRMTNVAGSA
jgi:hypothetical protein